MNNNLENNYELYNENNENIKKKNYKKIFIIFTLIGFLLAIYFNYLPSIKNNIRQELDIIINNTCYHIHHWIYYLLIIFFILLGRNINNDTFLFSFIGVLLGFILEDFMFLFNSNKNIFKIKNKCNLFKIKK